MRIDEARKILMDLYGPFKVKYPKAPELKIDSQESLKEVLDYLFIKSKQLFMKGDKESFPKLRESLSDNLLLLDGFDIKKKVVESSKKDEKEVVT